MPIKKTAAEPPDSTEPGSEPEAQALELYDMEKAPKDGSTIAVYNHHGEPQPARWRATRAWDGRRWLPAGKWVDPLTGTRILFQPVGWLPGGDK
jgi:hypothetical protein